MSVPACRHRGSIDACRRAVRQAALVRGSPLSPTAWATRWSNVIARIGCDWTDWATARDNLGRC